VLSPGAANIARDRDTKLTLSARREVGDYWIVDREAQRVDVYRRASGTLVQVATLGAEEAVTSPALPGFRLALTDLFRLPAWFPG
jgi:Uma2 family endonuclease